MLNKITVITFCILMVFQSMMAVADTHEAHQTDGDHVEFVHEHDETVSIDKDLMGSSQGYDCHHCCHCHGPTFTAIAPSSQAFAAGKGRSFSSASSPIYHSNTPALLLRPPIA